MRRGNAGFCPTFDASSCDRLKVARPDMAVLFMSGYTGAALGERGEVAEFSGQLLQKPFTPDGLNRRVREVLDA